MDIVVKVFQGIYLAVNSYLVKYKDRNEAFLVDPSTDKIEKYLLQTPEIKLKFILLTHAHFDHITFLDYFVEKYDIPFFVHIKDKDKLISAEENLSSRFARNPFVIKSEGNYISEDQGEITINGYSFYYYRYSGHCAGLTVYNLINTNIFFTGDLVFNTSVGRADLPDSSSKDQIESLRSFNKNHSSDILIYPGHGKSFYKRELINNKDYINIVGCNV